MGNGTRSLENISPRGGVTSTRRLRLREVYACDPVEVEERLNLASVVDLLCRSLGDSLRLAVFEARFYVLVGQFDEPAERRGVDGGCRFQFDMAHELAAALQ